MSERSPSDFPLQQGKKLRSRLRFEEVAHHEHPCLAGCDVTSHIGPVGPLPKPFVEAFLYRNERYPPHVFVCQHDQRSLVNLRSRLWCDVAVRRDDASDFGKTMARQFYYTDTARRRVVSQLLEKKEVENGEVTLRRKDSSPLILWYSAESIRDASGSMVAYSGYFQQRPFVFSSKLANDFARIVDALPGVAWVCGRDLRIVAVNDSYLEAYNRNRNDVIGRTEHDFLPAEQARYLVEAALRVFEEKQELLHPAVPHLLDPAVWFRTVRRPIFDDARQEVIGLLGIAQDISGKVRQENVFMEQLRATESDVVVVTDDQGRILRRSLQTLSPSIFGKREPFEAYTLDMRPVLDLLDVDDLPKVRQALHAALREHREQHIECRIRNLTGSYTTVLARLVFNDTIYGEPRMYVVARDIGGEMELRQASMVIERLKEAARAKTDRELARFLNVSAASISNARKNDRVPPRLDHRYRPSHRPFHRLAGTWHATGRRLPLRPPSSTACTLPRLRVFTLPFLYSAQVTLPTFRFREPSPLPRFFP